MIRPEVVLFKNVLTEVLSSELGRFFSAVTIKYAEVRQGDWTLLLGRIQTLKSDGIRIL